MPPSAQWQATVRGLELGAGTNYEVEPDGIGGLGVPTPAVQDYARGDRDGTVSGRDLYERRVLTLPIHVLGTTAEDVMGNLRTLKTAWKREKSTDEVELELRLPGFPGATETLSYFGRPRGMAVNLEHLKAGYVPALLTFEALDPLGYEPEDAATYTGLSGTFNVTGDGDEDTDRVLIEVTGNGGTPRLVSTTDGGLDITFAEALAGAATRTLDLRAHTCTDGGTDHYDELSPVSSWFVIKPGANSITLTGAASVDVTIRHAHT